MSPPSNRPGTVTVIDARRSRFREDLRELWRHRYLIELFVYRDFVVHYKQTILGPIWWLLQPVLTTIIFTIVFSNVANLPTDSLPAPLFYFAGIIVWNYFIQCFLHTSQSFLDNRAIYQKIFFPRLVIPVASILSNMMRLGLQMSLFVLLYLGYWLAGAPLQPTWTLLLLPLLIAYAAVLAFGLGLLVASLTMKYRDLILTLPFLTQLWMFASVIVYPLSLVPARWQFWFSLNPMVPAIELFRYMFFGAGTVQTGTLALALLTNLLAMIVGLTLFKQAERSFVDTI